MSSALVPFVSGKPVFRVHSWATHARIAGRYHPWYDATAGLLWRWCGCGDESNESDVAAKAASLLRCALGNILDSCGCRPPRTIIH